MSFFFVKAVKKIIIDSLHSPSLILSCFCGFGVFFKDKVDEIVLFTEFSMAAIFAVCFQQKCIGGQTIALCPRMECELFRLPSAQTQRFCCSNEVGSPWGLGSPFVFLPCVVAGHHLTVCESSSLWWALPWALTRYTLWKAGCIRWGSALHPTIIWLFCQHHLHPPISGHEQRELASAHKPCEHTWIFILYENWVLYKVLVQEFSHGDHN